VKWTPEADRALGGDGTIRKTFKPVVIESPLAGDVARHLRYLDACILDCIRRGETPYASHKMLPGALNDLSPDEREIGIKAGFVMAEALHMVGASRAVYRDEGVSDGMRDGMAHAAEIGQRVEHRRVKGWKAT
jgi:hypothetical protein